MADCFKTRQWGTRFSILAHLGFLSSCVLILLLIAPVAHAQELIPKAPEGFRLLFSAEGVWLFQKNYPSGTPDYVQVIDLSYGSSLGLLHAPIREPRLGKGVYGGDDPRFAMQSLEFFWQAAQKSSSRAFCVSNGSFFYMAESPTRLAFPLKVEDKVLTDGFGYNTFPEQKLMLELWEDHAVIAPFTKEELYGSTAPNIIAGLKEDASKSSKNAVGRTFVGISDRDGNGRFETILILNTSTALQSDVAQVLRDFGANKVMMLDGGGSTQLICQDKSIIESDRLIPQAIAVYAAEPSHISATMADRPNWIVALEGEPLKLDIQLTNSGEETWKPDEYQFIIDKSILNPEKRFDFEDVVTTTESITYTVNLAAYTKTGIYSVPLAWHIAHGERRFPGTPIDLHVVVLKSNGKDKQNELKRLIGNWSQSGNIDVLARVDEWYQEYVTSFDNWKLDGRALISLKDLVWVPALMLPVFLIVLVMIHRVKG
jgi:hypothetical protein